MKQKKAVIFVFSSSDAQWAIEYKKKHIADQVKILTGNISAQLYLVKNSISACDYKELLYGKNRNYYSEQIVPLYKQTSILVKYIINELNTYKIFGVSIIAVLQILIEAEVLNVFYAIYVYKRIIQKWNPQIFYFPKQTKLDVNNWEPSDAIIAQMLSNNLCQKQKIKYYESHNAPKQRQLHLSQMFTNLRSLPQLVLSQALRSFDSFSASMPTKSGVDFLLFSAGINLDFYKDVFKILISRSNCSFTVVTGNQSLVHELLLRKSNIPFIPLQRFNSFTMEASASEIWFQLEKEMQQKIKSIKFATFKLTKKETSVIKEKLEHVVHKYGLKFTKQILLAKKSIDTVKPRLIITTHDPGPSALPFVLYAKQNKIPTLVLLHGYHDLNFGADHKSDYMFVWGKLLQEAFIKRLNHSPKTIVQTGYPLMDHYFSHKSSLINRKKIVLQNPIRIGFLTTTYQIDPYVVSNFFFDVFSEIKKSGLPVVVKVRTHASQELEAIKELAAYFNVMCEYNLNCTLEKFITNSDIIYSWDTTALLWVLILKKPLFYSTPWWSEGYIPVGKYKGGWICYSAKKFISKVKDISENPQIVEVLLPGQKELLNAVLDYTDGTSSMHFVNELEHLIQKI